MEYSLIRAKWTTMSTEEKADEDQGRTFKHNSLIVKFNQLAKYLKMQGKFKFYFNVFYSILFLS